jgi:DNA-binding winged helix-turn-helix (wHTH) protein
MIYAFGPFELDDEHYVLKKGGAALVVQPRAFDLLLFLVRRGNAVSTRSQLLAGVWGGATVSGDAVAHAVRGARAALGDDDASPTYIETVRGRGYRFKADVALRPRFPAAPKSCEVDAAERIASHLKAAFALVLENKEHGVSSDDLLERVARMLAPLETIPSERRAIAEHLPRVVGGLRPSVIPDVERGKHGAETRTTR